MSKRIKIDTILKTWHSPSCQTNFTLDDIISKIKEDKDYTIHVGTDSHIKRGTSDKQTFASVICLLVPGKGACYFYSRDDIPNNFGSLSERILEEASRSLFIAEKIRCLDDVQNRKIIIHSDTNTNPRYPTTKCTDIIRRWVSSSGLDLEFVAKPDAWASTCVADLYSK